MDLETINLSSVWFGRSCNIGWVTSDLRVFYPKISNDSKKTLQFSGTPLPLKSDYVIYGWYLTRQYWAKRPSIPVNFQCPYCQIQHLSIVCLLFYCRLHLEKKEKNNDKFIEFIAPFDGENLLHYSMVIFIKFMFSKKATKFEKFSIWRYVVSVKSSV